MKCKFKSAFTLVELMVVMAIIGVLMGMILPAVSRVQEASRSAKCKSNLHQIGVACQMYRDAYSFYPSNPWVNFGSSGVASALVRLLPYCEYDNIARQGAPYPNLTEVPLLACPAGKNTIQYGVSAGLQVNEGGFLFISGGVFPFGENASAGVYRQEIGNEDIKDGLTNTIFLGERGSGSWHNPRGTACRSDVGINSNAQPGSEFVWRSKHAQKGANFCFGDAGVRFLKENIDAQVLAALSTRKGKENVSVPE